MLRTFSGNAITAKARAIYGKRLTTANYRELLRLRSVSGCRRLSERNAGLS